MRFLTSKSGTTILVSGLVLLLLALGLYINTARVPQASADILDNLAGHSWDDYYGTASYNSCNLLYDFAVPPPIVNEYCHLVDWGLNATFNTNGGGNVTSGEISGFMWHESLGWICVGNECLNWTAADECGSAVPPGGDVGLLPMYFTTPDADGWAEITQGYGKVCSFNDSGDAGWISFTCLNHSACGSGENYRLFLNVNDFTFGDPENTFDGSRNNGCLECGYAWNGYTSQGNDYGTGYMQFSPSLSVSHSIHFQGVDGTVYSFNPIAPKTDTDPVNTGVTNATYLVLTRSGSIINFSSKELYSVLSQDEYLQLNLVLDPDPDYEKILKESEYGSLIYRNALGFLDVGALIDGLVAPVTNLGSSIDTPTAQTLGGQVYYASGDFDVNAAVTIDPGSSGISGAGTFVVDGDLNINANIQYNTSTLISSVDYLPSAAFIVLGDINVSSTVNRLDGSYFALGDRDNLVCPQLGQISNGCGRYATGATSTSRLIGYGTVMARQFYFERTYTDALNNPAELIIYDGRLVANPPPGFKDIEDAMPVLSENIPF